MLEAMRILKATGLKMRRTVRIALWTGEEQGLLGSRAYVRDHFADRQTMTLKPGHAKLAAYFNVDNGTGSIRGVFLQRNEAVGPVFQAWMEPFKNVGMTTLAIRSVMVDRSCRVRRGGVARVSVHSGPGGVQHAGPITRTWTCTTGFSLPV